ncbi:MAG: DNA-processing protein DprA [Candidatus Nanoperiomorbaceae bacterium]
MEPDDNICKIPLENNDFRDLRRRLATDSRPPKQLFAKSSIPETDFGALFDHATVAIVGSRKVSDYGRAVTLKLARELAEHGVVIVAGLAIGVDSLAHRGALDGRGTTIAILGNGLAKVYPSQNRGLAEEIVDGGGVILSEYEPDVPVARYQFLERNRLIAALSDIVIVVEANLRSGSLNTARHAVQQGKILMAVPGNITAPLSAGTNQLIADGAAPVLNAESVITKLSEIYADRADILAQLANKKTAINKTDDDEAREILTLLSQAALTTDEILHKIPHGQGKLTMLELDGKIRRINDKWSLS